MKVDNLIVGKSKKLALRVMKLVQYLTQHKSPYFIIDQDRSFGYEHRSEYHRSGACYQ